MVIGSSLLVEARPEVIQKYGIRKYHGLIDELQIYDQALSEREIYALFTAGQDADGDGICDNLDRCPQSDRESKVVLGTCQPNVVNYLTPEGCTLNDQLAACTTSAKNRAQLKECVARLSTELLKTNALTAAEKVALERCAEAANLP